MALSLIRYIADLKEAERSLTRQQQVAQNRHGRQPPTW